MKAVLLPSLALLSREQKLCIMILRFLTKVSLQRLRDEHVFPRHYSYLRNFLMFSSDCGISKQVLPLCFVCFFVTIIAVCIYRIVAKEIYLSPKPVKQQQMLMNVERISNNITESGSASGQGGSDKATCQCRKWNHCKEISIPGIFSISIRHTFRIYAIPE